MLEKFNLFKQSPITIKSGELELFLIGKFERQKRESEDRLVPICGDIVRDFAAIEQLIISLRQKSAKEAYANTVKNRFCEKSLEAVNGMEFSNNYRSMSEYIKKSRAALGAISNIDMKEFRHLHAFSNDMAAVAERIKKIERGVEQGEKTANGSIMKKVEDLISEAGKIQALEKSIQENESELRSMQTSIDSANEKIFYEQETVSKLEDQILEYSEGKATIIELDRQMRTVRVRLDAEFSGLDRVFRKFLYYGDITKTESAVLQEYMKSPSEAFLEKDDQMAIKGIIIGIHSFRDRDSIEMDGEKFAKVEDLVRNFKLLSELKVHYTDLLTRRNAAETEFEQKAEPLIRDMKAVKAQVEARKREIRLMKTSLEEKKQKAIGRGNEIAGIRKSCEKKLTELLGRDAVIV